MSLLSFQEQIEAEREWRESEIRFLNNAENYLLDDSQRKMIRRSTICLIYAHIEGFIKFAFSLYVDEINKLGLTCSDVKPVFAAAAFQKEFLALADSNKKSVIFKKTLPDERHLHRLHRQSEFVENIASFLEHPVIIPEDYVNTENNVGQEVLEKLLFQVGLNHKDLSCAYSPLNRLLNVRNDIAHGKRKAGIDNKEFGEFVECCKSIIKEVSHRLTTAIGSQEYLLQKVE